MEIYQNIFSGFQGTHSLSCECIFLPPCLERQVGLPSELVTLFFPLDLYFLLPVTFPFTSKPLDYASCSSLQASSQDCHFSTLQASSDEFTNNQCVGPSLMNIIMPSLSDFTCSCLSLLSGLHYSYISASLLYLLILF